MPVLTDWVKKIQPVINKYQGRKHPLDYEDIYQLLVMVVLAEHDSDRHINLLAPKLFEKYPDISSLSESTPEKLLTCIKQVKYSDIKMNWLIDIAKKVKSSDNIPLRMDGLLDLPGIGRKEANLILREAGMRPEGVIVDPHVVRVAPRLGIVNGTNSIKIEKQLMETLPRNQWEAGMSMSFLGREVCKPKPYCSFCMLKPVCSFYNNNQESPGNVT